MDSNITIKMISREDIINAGCFNISETIKVIEKVLLSFKNGKVLLPDKISQIFNQESQNRINCMPATLLDENVCGVKWVSVFPNNPSLYNVPNVSGLIILSELEKGYPFAVMDGSFITAFRTACIGAIGAKYLARRVCKVIGIIGSGEQAKMHLTTIKYIHPEIEVCRVASRNSENEIKFIGEMQKQFPDLIFENCNSDYERASEGADVIVTAVSCQSPLLKAKTIKKGAFYCHVAGLEDEFDVALKADKIVCDHWESVKHRTQTISQLYQKGLLKDSDIYGNIVDIIDGTLPGRENDEEFIYFNSVGLSFIDIAVALSFYNKVMSKSLATDFVM